MSYRSSYASELRVCERYKLDPATHPMPLKRTHGSYRRRCAKCCRFLANQRRSRYCSTCNAERRRADRVRAGADRHTWEMSGISHMGENVGEVIRYLLERHCR